MLRHVALVRTDVLEELSASFIMVTRIGELGTTLAITTQAAKRSSVHQLPIMANTVPSSLIFVTLMMAGAKFLRNVSSYKSHMV
jgi:hypothetical protein